MKCSCDAARSVRVEAVHFWMNSTRFTRTLWAPAGRSPSGFYRAASGTGLATGIYVFKYLFIFAILVSFMEGRLGRGDPRPPQQDTAHALEEAVGAIQDAESFQRWLTISARFPRYSW